MQPLSRRYFFFGSLALASSCSRISQTIKPLVSIARVPSYSANLAALFRSILQEHRVAVAGKRIVLKPNLVEFSSHAPVNTNATFIAAAVEACHSLGAKDVRIAEGPGHRRMTLDLASAAGYFENIPGFEKSFTDLNLDDVTRMPLRKPFSTLTDLYLPNTVLGCDLLVSIPKMKTHHWAGATLAMKNLFGVVPGSIYGWPKNVLHWAGIHECIADLHNLFPRQFCLVDGIEAMEGNGPILGSRKAAGVVVAGAHPPSVDATCCRIMQIDPSKIDYLRYASSSHWNINDAHQIGETIPSVSTRFSLISDLQYLHASAKGTDARR